MPNHDLHGFPHRYFNGRRQSREELPQSKRTTTGPSVHRVIKSITGAVVTLGLVMMVLAGTAAATDSSNQVWVVDTRPAPSSQPADDALGMLNYRLLGDDGCQWQTADWEAFSASGDEKLPTAIFIHGNRTGYQSAIKTGLIAYRLLEREAAGQPFRFVVWSWPAERVYRRPRPDFQLKASRSDVQGCYLAQMLGQMDPDVPVTLIGHSYGARTITAAAHVLSGGTLAGWEMPEDDEPHELTQLRAVLVAAAMDNDWLLPGRRHGLALGRLDSVLLTQNWSDPGLRWYPLMTKPRGPMALGRTGSACPSMLGPDGEKLETVNVACSVGKNHDFSYYMRSSAVTSRLAQYTFPESADDSE
jgi:pimeloyl-ACP methyl ester carboxylesterase